MVAQNFVRFFIYRQTEQMPAFLKHESFGHHVRGELLQLLQGEARKPAADLSEGSSGLTEAVNGAGRPPQSEGLHLGSRVPPTDE